MEFKENIDALLADFKEGRFIYGEGCLGEVDIVRPQVPVFDYALTYNTPAGLTLDGALDGMSHCLGAAPAIQDQLRILGKMPVPLTSELVDEYMGSILEAAETGNLETIKNF